MRTFDPRAVGRRECGAWVAYYRRQWFRFLRYAVGMVRAGFEMSWPKTLYGAWLVLRANQLWAPAEGNDPDGARRCMRRFYELVIEAHAEPFDPTEAARLEVEWWRVHREAQRAGVASEELVDALIALYAHVYDATPESMRLAAQERAAAMVISDEWVADGCDPLSPSIAMERAALVRSYAALLAAVHR
ncbi:hypothetical protein [Alloactinosynnema sp. L-07]|uniref:hypothetical protein n=1 Tax=Alloactinosynnema sp. L-07 TaxID=1653480 RepID=UPI0006B4CBCD|nr:hypothetical protein [Alloactinosynnema sp. L-07]